MPWHRRTEFPAIQTDRRRAKSTYAVDYADTNGDLDRLRVDVTHPETVAGERLEPIHRILGKRSPVVANVFLLFSTNFTGNCINRAVTPRSTGRIRWPMSGTLAWQNRME
ncbi:MAG: hypothetical protein E5299_00992 [Burkholderia gladioli]|nr:MAG: hypothetical protein E5299_00992 [Burkholderia gladioli]